MNFPVAFLLLLGKLLVEVSPQEGGDPLAAVLAALKVQLDIL